MKHFIEIKINLSVRRNQIVAHHIRQVIATRSVDFAHGRNRCPLMEPICKPVPAVRSLSSDGEKLQFQVFRRGTINEWAVLQVQVGDLALQVFQNPFFQQERDVCEHVRKVEDFQEFPRVPWVGRGSEVIDECAFQGAFSQGKTFQRRMGTNVGNELSMHKRLFACDRHQVFQELRWPQICRPRYPEFKSNFVKGKI
jgi:hypothetical protein